MKRHLFNRRGFIRTSALALPSVISGCTNLSQRSTSASEFVSIRNRRFERHGKSYRFVGTNFPHAIMLGDPGWQGGRARLVRELDLLHSVGVINLRLLAGSEGSFQAGDGRRGLVQQPGRWDEGLLRGLDFTLAQMAERDMTGVLYLTNYWEWSGGMAKYVNWATGEPIPDPGEPGGRHTVADRMNFAARFYGLPRAQELFRSSVAHLLNRRNTVNGRLYAEEPAIMSWQLSNEPRPGTDEPASEANLPAFCSWMDETARFIKTRAPRQLVSTGSEGTIGCLGKSEVFLQAHQSPAVDYATLHVWVMNWGWLKEPRLGPQYEQAAARAVQYVHLHIDLADQLGKPLIMEEFGIGRDEGSTDADSPTRMRDDFYGRMFRCVLDSCRAGGPLQASNFWEWAGEGSLRAHRERQTRQARVHESVGYNGVLQSDRGTLAVIQKHSSELARMQT